MTRITNRQEYAIAMSHATLSIDESYTIPEPTCYSATDNIVRPGDICYTCRKPIERGGVFRSLYISNHEIYMEHEHHQPGIGHQRIMRDGSRQPYNSGFP